jgi:hypothetical protein
MICQIVNPSDAYTLECKDFLIGAVVVMLLGESKYGCQHECEEDEMSTPVLFGWDAWIEEHFPDGLDAFIERHRADIAVALDSVRLGSVSEREAQLRSEMYMAPEAIKAYRADIQERRRSSMNDIATRAWKIAEKLQGTK